MEEKRERRLHPIIECLIIGGIIFGLNIVSSFISSLCLAGKSHDELTIVILVLGWIALLYPVIATFLCTKVIEKRKTGIVIVVLVIVLRFSFISYLLTTCISTIVTMIFSASVHSSQAFFWFYRVLSFIHPIIDAVLATLFVNVFDTSKVEADMYDKKMYCGLLKHTLLLFFTFGIWSLVWILRTTTYLNCVKDEEQRNPATKLLLCMLVPYYSIYWNYKSAQRIDKVARSVNIVTDIATPCLILSFFVPIVPPILMQNKINKILETATIQPDWVRGVN